jgi:hypothetical protein
MNINKLKISFGIFVVSVFCIVMIPIVIILMNMFGIISWLFEHGLHDFISVNTTFVVLTLGSTGLLLILGLFLISRGEEWFLKHKGRSPFDKRGGSDEHAGPFSFSAIMNSLDNSVSQLREISRTVDARRREIFQIGQKHAMPPVKVQQLHSELDNLSFTEQRLYGYSSIHAYHTITPGSRQDEGAYLDEFQMRGLTETEIILLQLKKKKLDEESNPLRGKLKSQE